MIKNLLSGVAITLVLAGCQKPEPTTPPLDGKALADQFIKPQGGKATVGMLFDEQGQVMAIVTADGKLAQPCQLPSPENESNTDSTSGTNADNTKVAADTRMTQLPQCHGTTNTALYGISQITVINHKGSTCRIYRVSPPGINYQICW